MQLADNDSAAAPGTDGQQTASPYYAKEWNKVPVCLELRFADGRRKAVPYAHVTEINFDADAGIDITTTEKRVCITGRNLMALYESLVIYRVRYVQADMGNDTQEDGLFVAEILTCEL